VWQRVRRLVGRDAGAEHGDNEREAEVFPWLEHASAGGAVLGAVLAAGFG